METNQRSFVCSKNAQQLTLPAAKSTTDQEATYSGTSELHRGPQFISVAATDQIRIVAVSQNFPLYVN